MIYSVIKSSSVIFLLLLTTTILLLSSFSISSLVLFWILFFILNEIIKHDKSRTLSAFLIGIIFMIGLYQYWINFYGNSYYLGKMSDDWQYDVLWTEGFTERYGVNIYKITEHLNDLQRNLGTLHNSQGYVAVILFLKWFGSLLDGYHTFLPRIFNIFILTLTAYYSSLIAFYYSKNQKVKITTFLVVFFFPTVLFISSHIFRDTIISFILVYSYYLTLAHKYKVATFLKIFFLFFLLFYLRKSTFFVGLLIMLIMYINPKKINVKLLITLFMFYIFALFYLQNFVDELVVQVTSYSELNVERLGSIGSKIFSMPLHVGFISRIVYLIFTPVPSFTSLHQFYISISAFLQILFFPFLYYGLKGHKIDVKLKVAFLLLFLGVAMTTASFRHILMFLPFGIIITVLTYFYTHNMSGYQFYSYLKTLSLLIFIFILTLVLVFVY